jgi:hypothetical protein
MALGEQRERPKSVTPERTITFVYAASDEERNSTGWADSEQANSIPTRSASA